MTVIAYKENVLSADRCVIDQTLNRRTYATKIQISSCRRLAMGCTGMFIVNQSQTDALAAALLPKMCEMRQNASDTINFDLSQYDVQLQKSPSFTFLFMTRDMLFIYKSEDKTLTRLPNDVFIAQGSGGTAMEVCLYFNHPWAKAHEITAQVDSMCSEEFDQVKRSSLKALKTIKAL